jgi:hypothetical protein
MLIFVFFHIILAQDPNHIIAKNILNYNEEVEGLSNDLNNSFFQNYLMHQTMYFSKNNLRKLSRLNTQAWPNSTTFANSLNEIKISDYSFNFKTKFFVILNKFIKTCDAEESIYIVKPMYLTNYKYLSINHLIELNEITIRGFNHIITYDPFFDDYLTNYQNQEANNARNENKNFLNLIEFFFNDFFNNYEPIFIYYIDINKENENSFLVFYILSFKKNSTDNLDTNITEVYTHKFIAMKDKQSYYQLSVDNDNSFYKQEHKLNIWDLFSNKTKSSNDKDDENNFSASSEFKYKFSTLFTFNNPNFNYNDFNKKLKEIYENNDLYEYASIILSSFVLYDEKNRFSNKSLFNEPLYFTIADSLEYYSFFPITPCDIFNQSVNNNKVIRPTPSDNINFIKILDKE